jgi:hypothetical protein
MGQVGFGFGLSMGRIFETRGVCGLRDLLPGDGGT